MSPSIILADEPTGNLDTHSSEEIMGIFQELNREQGITIIFVTHESDIAQHTRRIVHIRDGRITSDEPVARQRLAVRAAAAGSSAGPQVTAEDHVAAPPGRDGRGTESL